MYIINFKKITIKNKTALILQKSVFIYVFFNIHLFSLFLMCSEKSAQIVNE